MIQQESLVKVADNSGAKLAKCIKVLGGKKKVAKIGDIVVVSIKKLRENNPKKLSKLKKKDIFKALVIRTKSSLRKKNGFYCKFHENSVVFLDKQKNPVGTRITGFMPKQLKKKFIKFVSIASCLI